MQINDFGWIQIWIYKYMRLTCSLIPTIPQQKWTSCARSSCSSGVVLLSQIHPSLCIPTRLPYLLILQLNINRLGCSMAPGAVLLFTVARSSCWSPVCSWLRLSFGIRTDNEGLQDRLPLVRKRIQVSTVRLVSVSLKVSWRLSWISLSVHISCCCQVKVIVRQALNVQCFFCSGFAFIRLFFCKNPSWQHLHSKMWNHGRR